MNLGSNQNLHMNSVLERKQTTFGLIHDIYTLAYCLVFIPLCLFGIISNSNPFGQFANILSWIYFISTGLINVYHREYNFVLHHIVCIGLIYTNTFNNLEYSLWLSKCYLAEVSNIFLSMKNILKHIKKNNLTNIDLVMIEKINNVLFVLAYFGIRICYLIPMTLFYMRYNYLKLNWNNFILVNVFAMCILNLYWGILIVKKVKTSIIKNTKTN